MRTVLILFALGLCQSALMAADWPVVSTVEAQPLLAQVQRLDQALSFLGQPLPEETRKALAALKPANGDQTVTEVQKLLDNRCMAAVEIGSEGVAKVTAGSKQVELVEQGWRACLVKVVNRGGSTGILQADSPNAQPVPKGPQDKVAERWMMLMPHTSQPLLPNLSGLGLEYTVMQVYSRDAGDRQAVLHFSLAGPKGSKPPSAKTELTFNARPSIPVTFKVAEFDGTPCTAAFLIRDKEGRVYPAQAKRLAPDFFFHPQVYRATGETVRLPAGKYAVLCSRGPESIPEAKELVVGDQPVTFSYTVQRWIDPSTRGWWSGDHHIHAAGCLHYENPTEGVEPSDMMRHVLGEDLKVGCCLTWGPCFDYQKRFFTGKPDNVSKYPYLLRYDVEVSGFGSHASGHLNLLKLKEQIYPGGDSKKHWPTLGMNTLRWAKKQGGITGPAHSGNGLTRMVGKIEGAQDGPHGLPNFNIPAYDGIGANEYIVDATHTVPGPDGKPVPALDFISAMDTDRVAEWNMWYHTLNCGYRIRVSGETDFPCISGDRVGMGRVYVKVPGKLDFDRWVDGIQEGRSYVSDGTTHLMDFTARTPDGKTLEVGDQGSEVRLDKPGQMLITAQVAGYQPGKKSVPVELVVNGQVLNTVEIPSDGTVQKLAISAPIQKSSWVALRVFPSAHTNPIFVMVDNKPIRASKDSARWCLAGVEQCWKMKEKTYAQAEQEQARADYAHARKEFQRILEECDR